MKSAGMVGFAQCKGTNYTGKIWSLVDGSRKAERLEHFGGALACNFIIKPRILYTYHAVQRLRDSWPYLTGWGFKSQRRMAIDW